MDSGEHIFDHCAHWITMYMRQKMPICFVSGIMFITWVGKHGQLTCTAYYPGQMICSGLTQRLYLKHNIQCSSTELYLSVSNGQVLVSVSVSVSDNEVSVSGRDDEAETPSLCDCTLFCAVCNLANLASSRNNDGY